MRLDLALARDYCPTWGLWEGIRDLVQNYLDGADKGFTPKMAYSKNGQVLTLINEGANLPREAMLIGFSSKRGDDTQRGQYGEGLKIALLALTRAGLKVTIRSGGEKLTPRIEWNKKFGAETLCVDVTKCEHFDGIKVNVWGLAPEAWSDIKGRFLPFRSELWQKTAYNTWKGALLTDLSDKGQIFADGIYVCTREDFQYGYDIRELKLDRDRTLPDSWDLKFATAQITSAAMAAFDASKVLDSLMGGSEETSAMSYTTSADQKSKLAHCFLAEFGEHAVPVSMHEKELAAQITDLGGTPVFVNEATKAVVGGTISASAFIESRASEIECEFLLDGILNDVVWKACARACAIFEGDHAILMKFATFKRPQNRVSAKNTEMGPVVTVPIPLPVPSHCLIGAVAEALVSIGVYTVAEVVNHIDSWRGPESYTRDYKPSEDGLDAALASIQMD